MKSVISSRVVGGVHMFTVLDTKSSTLCLLKKEMLSQDIFGVSHEVDGDRECIRVETVYDMLRKYMLHFNVHRKKFDDFDRRYLVYKPGESSDEDYKAIKEHFPGVETMNGYKIDCYSKDVSEALHALM